MNVSSVTFVGEYSSSTPVSKVRACYRSGSTLCLFWLAFVSIPRFHLFVPLWLRSLRVDAIPFFFLLKSILVGYCLHPVFYFEECSLSSSLFYKQKLFITRKKAMVSLIFQCLFSLLGIYTLICEPQWAITHFQFFNPYTDGLLRETHVEFIHNHVTLFQII